MTSLAKAHKGQDLIQRIAAMPSLAPVIAEVLCHAQSSSEEAAYWEACLPVIARSVGGDYVTIVGVAAGRWGVQADTGQPLSLPVELLAEALDQEAPRFQGPWAAVPLAARSVQGQVLAVHGRATVQASGVVSTLAHLAPILLAGLANVQRQAGSLWRIRRLETLLDVAKQWNQTRELQPLLNQVAEAATRLLGSDRASIFLWDRPNHLLVGRPALGAPGNELRIPDDRGVVGQVIRSGQPLRVDAASEPQQIDRQVDSQLGYRTRNLLCVPLRGSSGELFGAFELINKHAGAFTEEDEVALIELAALAAVAMENAQDRQQLLTANRRMAEQAAERIQFIGQSPAIDALRSVIRRVADTELAVLILGENGTGKEVAAQSIHYWSRRRERPFIAVNCAAIPESLAESELFGHEKGAFTDAREARAGKFELAAGGTLFLDEIGDLTLGGQSKLLRVLEEKLIVRVGGSTPIHTDARVIAATNQNLAEMVRQKRFREDLYFRLNVVTLDLPPLRDRPEDILLLAEHFLKDFCAKARRRVPQFSAAARKRLESHAWPGNVRELRNLMERLAYLQAEDRIEADEIAFILSPRGESAMVSDMRQTLADATFEFQVEYIKRAVQQAQGNMSEAASRLGLHRSNLYRKMRQLGMSAPE